MIAAICSLIACVLLTILNWRMNGHRPTARKVILTAALIAIAVANLWVLFHGW